MSDSLVVHPNFSDTPNINKKAIRSFLMAILLIAKRDNSLQHNHIGAYLR